MIIYLDTSALVKRYIFEQGSDQVHQKISQVDTVTTSLITYPEALSAFSRNLREHSFDRRYYNLIRLAFEKDWRQIHVIDFSRQLSQYAGRLIHKHGLRALDAIHLATAMQFKSWISGPVTFLCFDERLSMAAEAEGMNL